MHPRSLRRSCRLATICLGLWFPNVFRRLAVMSPSIWWDNEVLFKMIEALDEETKPPLRIWLDTGTQEEGWPRAPILRDGLIEKGWRLHDDLHYFEDENAGHTEAAWAHRIDAALRFLFPPPSPIIAVPRRRRFPAIARRKLIEVLGWVGPPVWRLSCTLAESDSLVHGRRVVPTNRGRRSGVCLVRDSAWPGMKQSLWPNPSRARLRQRA